MDWELMSTIPSDLAQAASDIVLRRTQPGYDEIWISAGRGEPGYEELKYYVFRTDSHDWTGVAAPPSPWLFVNSQNNVWAGSATRGENLPVLFRQDAAGEFWPIIDRDGKLVNGSVVTSHVQVSPDGSLWFVFRDHENRETLYSLDPRTLVAKARLTGEFGSGLEMDAELERVSDRRGRAFSSL